MGVAKAALEACTRYIARDLGPQGIRVNAISAGAIRTLSLAGISGGRSMIGAGPCQWSPLGEDTAHWKGWRAAPSGSYPTSAAPPPAKWCT